MSKPTFRVAPIYSCETENGRWLLMRIAPWDGETFDCPVPDAVLIGTEEKDVYLTEVNATRGMAAKCCGNCRFYDAFIGQEQFGFCTNHPKEGTARTHAGKVPTATTLTGFSPVVTDLSLCSGWSPKESAQESCDRTE